MARDGCREGGNEGWQGVSSSEAGIGEMNKLAGRVVSFGDENDALEC